MVAYKNQAWVTSVFDNDDVNKAIVLAGSLRRVLTTKKLVAIYTESVSEDNRDLLRDKYDLALLIDKNGSNDVHPLDFAKIFAFSLTIFDKCVYLATSTLVLQNCDDIFDIPASFASRIEAEDVDLSVYLFTPYTQHYKAMKNIAENGNVWQETNNDKFCTYFGKWIMNQVPNVVSLDTKYNQRISLLTESDNYNGLPSDLGIVNFRDFHPIEIADKIGSSTLTGLGLVESFVADKWRTIYMEEIWTRNCLQAMKDEKLNSMGSVYDTDLKTMSNAIAIIGMGCRFPGANGQDERENATVTTPDEFWNLLIEGREGIRNLPHHRWKKDTALFLPSTRKVRGGFLGLHVDEFDAKFFGVSRKDAVFLDPQQRLLHEVMWEALEDAGIDPLSLYGSHTGVFIGSWIHDYKEMAVRHPDVDFFRVYLGNSIAAGAARLSHFLGLTGPSIATESGCSSAIVAVDMACQNLRNRNTNLAIVGGVNLLLHPFDSNVLSFVVAPDGRCKTFDAKANGFGRAEGCGVIILKTMSDAIRDGDKIWGLIRGSAVTQEGISQSLGTPTVQCEALAMELALGDADIKSEDVSYIETHGTGTPVGDPMEVAAIAKVYQSPNRKEPLVIGSVKTNIGHTESVSGIAGIMKVVLSLKHETIPRHLHFNELNPEINLDSIPAVIPVEEMAWPRMAGKPRLAGVSSFGISGSEVHVIVQEAPDLPMKSTASHVGIDLMRPLHIMKISAKSTEALDDLIQRHQDALAGGVDSINFADYAYTANVGRATFNHRACVVAKNAQDAANILKQRSFDQSEVTHESVGKLCFLFTGQGAQYPGMAKTLYETSPVFRVHFDACDRTLQKLYKISLRSVLWGEGSSNELSRTIYSQTSIFCVEYALLKLWESWGIKPNYVLGHSLGEFCAAVAAGVLAFEDALKLVAERSRLIDVLPQGKMVVLKADRSAVNDLLNDFMSMNPGLWLDYAALNSWDQTVLAGESTTVEKFAEFCEEKNTKTIILAATHAFHSRHMDPMLKAYSQVILETKPMSTSDEQCVYVSGVEGKIVSKEDLLKPEYWIKHTREKVNFIDACKAVQHENCTYFLEVGPHPVLSALVMANIDSSAIKCFPSLRRNQEDWMVMLNTLSKIFLGWKGCINWKGYEYFQRSKISIPLYPFQRTSIWADIEAQPQKLHPLLGSASLNASATSIYQNVLTVKQAPYLSDHVIANLIVFPAAAFLEMLLAAGHCHVQGLYEEFIMPRRQILLKNMKISNPLALGTDSKSTKMQVIVDLIEEKAESHSELKNVAGYESKVFHWHPVVDGNGHWVPHASGTFLPLVSSEVVLNMTQINIKEIQETWEESKTISADLYKRLPEVGLKFGPTFQVFQDPGWRKENDGFLIQVKVPEGVEKYIAHPVLVDAMIQGAMLWNCIIKGKDRVSKKLHVPIRIGEFAWLHSSDSQSRFVHVSKDAEGSVRITLLDGEGLPLMTMTDVDFVETSASVVISMINSQSSQVPTLWQEIWRHRPGPKEFGVPKSDDEKIFPDDVIEKVVALNKLDPENYAVYQHLDKMTVLHFLKALYELGWKPIWEQEFTLETLMSELHINDNFTNFVRFFIKCLVQDGQFISTDMGTYAVHNSLLTKDELITVLSKTATEKEASRPDFKIIYEIGHKLPDILLGKIPPLNILFPESSGGLGNIDVFYSTIHEILSRSTDILLNVVIARYEEAKIASGVANHAEKLRVLEVGAGTGVHTGLFLNVLKGFGSPYEYYYTDISAAFFSKAQEKFSDYEQNMVFQKFNIEEDPLSQGFCIGYFDIIIAAEVIHTTRNIKEALSNLRLLLRDKGYIQILETTAQDRRLTFIFGLLDGYWRFQDFDLRPDHVCLQAAQWENVLNSTGFDKSIALPCFESVHSTIFAEAKANYYPNGRYSKITHFPCDVKPIWLVFGNDSELSARLVERLESLERCVMLLPKSKCLEEITCKECIEKIVGTEDETKSKKACLEGVIYLWGLVDENETNQESFLRPFLYLCQFLWDHQKMSTKTFVLTHGICNVEDGSAHSNPSPATLVGLTKVLRTETCLLIKCIDIPANKSPDDLIENIFYELWYHDDEEDTVAYCGDKDRRFSPRFSKLKMISDNLPLPRGSDRFQLALPATKIIQDLEFTFLNCYTLGENEIEVKVKAAALNFRDVFCVLKPIAQFDKINAIGTDFSGVVVAIGSKVTKVKLGDSVFGCNLNDQQALPSHIKITEDAVVPMPGAFTFAEASTLPAVFSTAFYCLVMVANIKQSDTVLIHTASGGVGLSAIQIAQHFGAKIIATAGSHRKRAYLKSLGIQHVYDSRNTDYGEKILEVTNGTGVEIVLNSLTGSGFKETSLKCCATNARFVEMSKLSTWTVEEVKDMRPDVQYSLVDLTKLEEPVWRKLFEQMKKYVDGQVVKPIPHVRFDAVGVRSALHYLQKAKHIGKIVCIMPEIKLQDSKFVVRTPLFSSTAATYLITGGITGGIGLEIAKYMLSEGAKYMILVGRNKPNDKTQQLLDTWKNAGYHVNVWQADVGDFQQCQDLINKIKDPNNGLPPLRGIMHAAGTLSDGTLPNQTWEKFEYTLNAKVQGSWNLHNLTTDCRLEHFVFFSSVSANFGTPAQANHAAGNAFEDALAYYRNSIGLPATTINWGTWGQVGIATEVEIPGFRPLSTQQGIMALDAILRNSRIQTGVLNVESFSVFSKFCPRIKIYIDDRSLFAEVKGPVFSINSDEFWNEVDNVEGKGEKEEVFRKYIKIMIRTILKMDPDEAISDEAEFPTLGIDSLMMLEMKNNLQNLFGNRMTVSASELKGCNTTRLLASKLVDMLLCSAAAEEVLPTMEELRTLIQEDSKWTETSNNLAGNPGVGVPSKIKTLLVTGATGTLAPYILRLIVRMPQISRIVCLIRKRGNQTGKDRLLSTLQATGLDVQISLEDNIECVDGDIGQSKFGLRDEDYDKLAEEIDGIIHCAAKVDHLQGYRTTGPQEKFHIRNINVLGTRNILEFARYKKVKLVLHASTFASIYSINNEKGCLSEEWEPYAAPEKIPLNNGYTISKYVAEQLVRQAVETGIPCKSLRFPVIAGDSATGKHGIHGNHAMLRFLTYMKVGALPLTPFPIVQLPVDYCAEVAVKIFFSDNIPHEVFNIIPKYPVLEQEFPKIAASFGYKVEIVEYSDFLEKLKAFGEASPIHAFMEHYEDEDRVNSFVNCPAIPSMKSFLTEDLQKYFYSEKMQKYCPDLYDKMECPLSVVKRDLQYLKANGGFEKFGMN